MEEGFWAQFSWRITDKYKGTILQEDAVLRGKLMVVGQWMALKEARKATQDDTEVVHPWSNRYKVKRKDEKA